MNQSIKFTAALSLLFILCNLISPKLFAQVPNNGIFFQAVARDNFSNPAKDRKIFIQSSIIQSTATGPEVLTEEHVANTDETGVFSISLGNGRRTGGSVTNLINIDWAKGPYYLSLKIAITPTAPIENWQYWTEWIPLGTTLFGTVPYALYAGTTANADQKVNIADTAKMLITYAKVSAVKILETGLATKLTATDTSTMLANYAKTNQTIDTAFLKSQLATKLSLIVPYTGATAGVNLGAFDLLVNGISVGKGGGNSATNTAIGDAALKANTEGFYNTAIGNSALKSNTTGNYNSANGASSLYANTTGSNNTANGLAALAYNTTGDGNTVNGSLSLLLNTTGSYNTANGYYVLYSNTTGTYNTAIGQGALYVNTTGGKNTAIGFNADVVSGALTNSTAIGAEAKVNASNTIQLGNENVTNVKTSGTITAGVVTYPNAHGTSGQVLTTSGTGTLSWTTVSGGGGVTTVGSIGTSNVNGATINGTSITLSPADATNGGIVTTGAQIFAGAKTFNVDLLVNGISVGRGGRNRSSNTAIGVQALTSNTLGNYNTANGSNALYSNTTGNQNTANGYEALYLNTTGEGNTANGKEALRYNTIGTSNTASGLTALYNNTTGNQNTANGQGALYFNNSGTKNTAIGYAADVASGALTNATAIGADAKVNASNTIQLGNGNVINVKTSGTITAGFVTYPKTNGTDGQVLTANTNGAASWTTVAGGGGVTTVGSIGVSNVNGATISGTTITLSPADATNGGIVTSGAQIFAGAKTFNADLLVNGLSVGKGAGNISSNSAIGNLALNANTTGWANTGNGYYSLYSNTTGYLNTANGYESLKINTTGAGNTSNGSMSLIANTEGSSNTANGTYSLYQNTTGSLNTASGYFSLYGNTTGTRNTAIGYNADVASGALTNATAIGYKAVVDANNTIQLGNTDVSDVKTSGTITAGVVTYPNAHGTSGQVLTTSGTGTLSWTTVSGGGGGVSTVGSIGVSNVKGATISGTTITLSPADATNGGIVTTGAQIFAGAKTFNADLIVNGLSVGKGGGNVSSNTANGNTALKSNTTGNYNAANGASSLYANTEGFQNTANGAYSLYLNTTGYNNTANGATSLYYNTTGRENTANGALALYSNTEGYQNTANGSSSLSSNTTGCCNTATGNATLYANTTGSGNTANGYVSMQSNTTGSSNAAYGSYSLLNNITASDNAAFGYTSMYRNTTGSSNSAFGYNSLGSNTTGSFNTANGYRAGSNLISGSNNIIIGNNAQATSTTVSNEITLGNSSIATLRAQVTSITALSDRRDKTNIIPISEGLEFLKKLNPVSFTWNTRDKAKVGIKSAGFIAQDLLALQKQSIIGDNLDLVSENNPEKLEARYGNLLPIIVKAIQEESAEKDKMLEDQQKEIKALKERLNALEKIINELLNKKQ